MTPLQAAHAKIEQLKDELRLQDDFIKDMLKTYGVTPEKSLLLKFQGEWNLTTKEAQILVLLYQRGTLVNRDGILTALYSHPDDAPEAKIVDVFVSKLRGKIGKTAIATHWGHGYQLTQQGREACDRVAAAEMKPRPPNANYGKVRFPKERGANV